MGTIGARPAGKTAVVCTARLDLLLAPGFHCSWQLAVLIVWCAGIVARLHSLHEPRATGPTSNKGKAPRDLADRTEGDP